MGDPVWGDVPTREETYGDWVRSHQYGYVVLTNSFQSLFHSSLAACLEQYHTTSSTSTAPYQPAFFLDCLALFRSCRSTESLLYRGYPLDAYALLRDVADRAIFLGAWAVGLSSYQALNATSALQEGAGLDRDEIRDRIRRAREQEQGKLLRLMMGAESGLDPDTIVWLRRWRSLFNLQVHGSRLTTASDFSRWVRRREPLSLGPVPDVDDVTVYTNTSPEVYWMILRLLPFMQLSPGVFGPSWAYEWSVLDESFDFYQSGFEALGKPMGTAIRRFIEAKFKLRPGDAYIEYGPNS